MSKRILIVDDDERLADMLSTYLSNRGLQVEHRASGTNGLQAIEKGAFDAVVLDIMLPDIDGFEVCRRVRAVSSIPIIMLTARGDEMDRIVGLEIGADDYLPKPFNPRELLARIMAVLRRVDGGSADPKQTLKFGRLVIDPNGHTASVDGKRADLTSHQFSLLLALAKRAGRVQSRDQLMNAVRGEELEAFDRSIDVHISRIRNAIEVDPKKPKYVLTVRGVGYVLAKTTDEH